MDLPEKLAPIRKGLLEFVILKIVAGEGPVAAASKKLCGANAVVSSPPTIGPAASDEPTLIHE